VNAFIGVIYNLWSILLTLKKALDDQ